MKQFDEWNEVKKNTENNETVAKFRQKEIFATALGQNVGFEQNGKGDDFLRPVLIEMSTLFQTNGFSNYQLKADNLNYEIYESHIHESNKP